MSDRELGRARDLRVAPEGGAATRKACGRRVAVAGRARGAEDTGGLELHRKRSARSRALPRGGGQLNADAGHRRAVRFATRPRQGRGVELADDLAARVGVAGAPDLALAADRRSASARAAARIRQALTALVPGRRARRTLGTERGVANRHPAERPLITARTPADAGAAAAASGTAGVRPPGGEEAPAAFGRDRSQLEAAHERSRARESRNLDWMKSHGTRTRNYARLALASSRQPWARSPREASLERRSKRASLAECTGVGSRQRSRRRRSRWR